MFGSVRSGTLGTNRGVEGVSPQFVLPGQVFCIPCSRQRPVSKSTDNTNHRFHLFKIATGSLLSFTNILNCVYPGIVIATPGEAQFRILQTALERTLPSFIGTVGVIIIASAASGQSHRAVPSRVLPHI